MIPHSFDSLLEKTRSPSFFAGAGLSAGVVPGPVRLFNDRKEIAEEALGVGSDKDSLYDWAEAILDQLPSDNAEPPKLRLAKALGLFENPSWRGDVSFPVRGTAARHRVVARFAREELWASAWTWNWDCVLERALEAIGFERGDALRNQPWLTRYNTVVVQEDFPKLGEHNLFCLLKPHGCVNALELADEAWASGDANRAIELADRFKISAGELEQASDSPTDTRFFQRMTVLLLSSPALIVGWSVSEPYLVKVINDALSDKLTKKGQLEELSIVDLSFNDAGHAETADCYGLTEAQVFFRVDPGDPGFTTDRFFLWLQARFCLQRLAAAAPNDQLKERLIAGYQLIEPPANESLIDWADSFIPAWCRLCWRANTVRCAGFDYHQLSLETPEEHIPLRLAPLPRPDLAAASQLFDMFMASPNWDLTTFAGAFWRSGEQRLVVPLPTWSEVHDLAALKPWVIDCPIGMIERVDILPVHVEGALPIDEALAHALRSKLGSALGTPYFADPQHIGIVSNLE